MQNCKSNNTNSLNKKYRKLFENIHNRFPNRQTTLPIKTLVVPAKNTRSKTIPRPQNCFIIFRREITATLTNSGDRKTVKTLSKVAGDRWQELKKDKQNHPDKDRDLDFWKLLCKIADCQHKLMYPDYK